MRVFECNECGEALSAATDAELASRVTAHMGEEHQEELDADEAQDLVADQAYEASDS